MSYCINPDCHHRENSDNVEFCQACGTPLLIQGKYQLLQPLRPLDPDRSTEIFEVADAEERKVMKVLKRNSSKLIELFEQEAFTLSVLNHPSIPKIDLDGDFTVQLPTSKTLHCLVMEKIEGQNLEQWVQDNGKISQKLARNWLKQLLEVLDYIHNNGFFHRDIKPSNIMLKPDGNLAIIDFGTVREITDTYMIAFRGSIQPNITSIVSRGYTAPEQFNGKALPQSDLFSLGRTFVHLLTAIPPSELPNHPRTNQLIWRSRSPQISRLFADLIDDLMAPLPKDRPKDSSAVLSALDNLFLHSVECFVTSRRFKLVRNWLLVLGIMLLLLNKLVISPLRADIIYSKQGREALNAGDYEKARRNLENAVKLDSKDPLHRNDLGLACEILKEFECAEKQYKQALEYMQDSEFVADVQYNLGVLYEERREFDKAFEQYRLVMQSSEEVSIDAINRYVRLLIWQKHNSKLAIQLSNNALKKIQSIDTTNETETDLKAVLYKNLGWAYLYQNFHDRAEYYFEKSIELEKKSEDMGFEQRAAPYCLLAKVLEIQEKHENALYFWENCQNLNSYDAPEVETWQSEATMYLNIKGK